MQAVSEVYYCSGCSPLASQSSRNSRVKKDLRLKARFKQISVEVQLDVNLLRLDFGDDMGDFCSLNYVHREFFRTFR